MVTVTVVRSFYDLHRHKRRKVGDTFEATDGRAAQIAATLPGYVTYEVDVPVEAPVEEPAVKDPQEDLAKFTVAQLKGLCEERGISVPKRAKKAEILALLEE